MLKLLRVSILVCAIAWQLKLQYQVQAACN